MILCYEVINLKKLREQLKTLSKYVNVIFDLTNIDLNTKPILNMVVKKVNIIEDFKIYYDINVDYSVEISEATIAKLSNLKVSSDDSQCLIEKLCDYVDIIVELMPVKLLIVVFLKEYLNEAQISQFYDYCMSKDCNLMLIESSSLTRCYNSEQLYIIDDDLCCVS